MHVEVKNKFPKKRKERKDLLRCLWSGDASGSSSGGDGVGGDVLILLSHFSFCHRHSYGDVRYVPSMSFDFKENNNKTTK